MLLVFLACAVEDLRAPAEDTVCRGSGHWQSSYSYGVDHMSAAATPDGRTLWLDTWRDRARTDRASRQAMTWSNAGMVARTTDFDWGEAEYLEEWVLEEDGEIAEYALTRDGRIETIETHLREDGRLLEQAWDYAGDGAVDVRDTWSWQAERPSRVERVGSGGLVLQTWSWIYVDEPPSLDGVMLEDLGADGTIDVAYDRAYNPDDQLVWEKAWSARGSIERAWTWSEGRMTSVITDTGDYRAVEQWLYDPRGLLERHMLDTEFSTAGIVSAAREEKWEWECP